MTDTGLGTGTAIVLRLGLAAAVGVLAQRFNRSGVGWFLVAIALPPLVAGVLVLALGRRVTT